MQQPHSFCVRYHTHANLHYYFNATTASKQKRRKCQKEAWKAGHKHECVPVQHNEEIAAMNDHGASFQRVDKFLNQYKPLLDRLAVLVLRTGFGESDDLYETHVAVVDLVELKTPGRKAKLSIGRVHLKHVDTLCESQQCDFHRLVKESIAHGDCTFTQVSYIQFAALSVGLMNCTVFRGSKADLLGSLYAESILDGVSPMEVQSKDYQKQFIRKKVAALSRAINDMVSGKDKDLRASSKPSKGKK